MPSHSRLMPVRLVDDRFEYRPCDVVVHFEPTKTFGRPIAHRSSRLLGVGDDDVAEEAARTIEVWAREMNLRPRCLPMIDRALQILLDVWMIRPSGPNCRHAE